MESAIRTLIQPRPRDLGGFSVRRVLPAAGTRMVGPFIFFDHMGPADFAPGTGIDVRPHPHIGIATVTYLYEGALLHRDSLGCVQSIEPGAVNWMTAGRGIVHSEKVTEEVRASGQRLHGLQTWVALPDEAEEIEPCFEHYAAADIPEVTVGGAVIRVVLGSAFGVSSPVTTHGRTLYVEVLLEPGQSVAIPDAAELAVYVVEGGVTIGRQRVAAGVLAVLEAGARGTVTAEAAARIMFAGGDAIDGKRYIWWNFVSSSRERIERAKDDWREQRFASVPGEDDFIPLPER